VIPFISKQPGLPDLTPDQLRSPDELYASGPYLHEYIKEMNREALAKYDVVTVGEAAGTPLAKAPLLIDDRRGELNLIFQFDIPRIGRDNWRLNPWTLVEWKALWDRAGGVTDRHLWNTVFLSNHDSPRLVNTFGDASPAHRVPSAKLLAMLLLTQKGTPFLYQGDEIGMTNYPFIYAAQVLTGKVPAAAYLASLKRTGRDNARTPMQWTAGKNAGFSTADRTWLPVNPDYPTINVATEANDPRSILAFYHRMLAFRKGNLPLIYGDYADVDPAHARVFAYRRTLEAGGCLVVLNLSGEAVTWTLPGGARPGALVLGNFGDAPAEGGALALRPWEARLYRL
jgi:oligo-1,6-glucosidase